MGLEAQSEVDFYRKWVTPHYSNMIGGYFVQTHAREIDLKLYADQMRPLLVEIDEGVFSRLYQDQNWRGRMVGYWFAGIKRIIPHTSIIGSALRTSPQHAIGQVFALTRLNHPDGIAHIEQYLTETLVTETDRMFHAEGWSVDWALAALVTLDELNRTQVAPPYLEPSGWLERFVRKGYDYFEMTYANRPETIEYFKQQWNKRWNVDRAKAGLQRALDFASNYFPDY